MSTSSGVTHGVAEFVSCAAFDDLPTSAAKVVTDAITDCLGVAIAGVSEPASELLLPMLGAPVVGRGAPLLATSTRSTWQDAALYIGTAAHAIDYDDTSHPAFVHPSAYLLPTLLSLGAYAKADGRELVLAYVVGLELSGKLGSALNLGHYARGWHATSTLGSLGAAAAGARLLRLDPRQCAAALAIAASSASGLRANFGTMTKPLHAGLAARNGVLAALLAERGVTGSHQILEAKHGYLAVFAGADEPRLAALGSLGRHWEVESDFGLALKVYPSCGATHAAIEAALAVGAELGQDKQVAEIVVGRNPALPNPLPYRRPATSLEAKFSMEFCVAAAIVRGRITMATFSEDVMSDADVQRVMEAVIVRPDERVRHETEFGATLRAVTTSGRTHERVVHVAKGKRSRWLSTSELRTKFYECASPLLGCHRARSLFDLVQRLPQGGTGFVEEIAAAAIPSPINRTVSRTGGRHGRV